MKIIRIVAALILTLILLRIAKETSRGHPEHLVRTVNGFTFDMMTVPKGPEKSNARIEATIKGGPGTDFEPVLLYTERGINTPPMQYEQVPMLPVDSVPMLYYANVPTGERGGRLHYMIDLMKDDIMEARLAQADGKPFELRYIGDVPKVVLIGHIGLMFATVFCVIMAALHALSLVRGGGNVIPMERFFFWSFVFALVGGYPFGFGMNWFAFHSIWEGVPFGTDATDNKTQLLVAYLLLMTVANLGTLTRGKLGKDIWSPKTSGYFGVAAFVLMLVIYLIPHSIQFSAVSMYLVCYGFIALAALIYLIGIRRARGSTT